MLKPQYPRGLKSKQIQSPFTQYSTYLHVVTTQYSHSLQPSLWTAIGNDNANTFQLAKTEFCFNMFPFTIQRLANIIQIYYITNHCDNWNNKFLGIKSCLINDNYLVLYMGLACIFHVTLWEQCFCYPQKDGELLRKIMYDYA